MKEFFNPLKIKMIEGGAAGSKFLSLLKNNSDVYWREFCKA